MTIDTAFWQGRRVLVTGHSGFMGGWLSFWLHRLGAKVSGYALPPATNPNLFHALRLADCIDVTEADVRDLDSLRACVSQTRPEVVLHLAAQPLVRRAYAEPLETYATNVMGTVNLLEAVRSIEGVRVVVVVTSDKVYDNQEWSWGYRELDSLGGREPYGTSKACCELVMNAYRRSYLERAGIGIATVRAGNVIGGGDWAEDRLIPDAVRAFWAGRALSIRNPKAIRPWQHVLEPIKGYLTLAQRLWEAPVEWSGAWNFGPQQDDARPVAWVIDQLITLWGQGAAWLPGEDGGQPYEARLLSVDSAKARTLLGWRPVWRVEEALQHTVHWYRQHGQGADMTDLSHRQIEMIQYG